jgi:hypothetical protein
MLSAKSIHTSINRLKLVFSAGLLSLCSLLAIYSPPAQAADVSSRQQAIDMALQQDGRTGKILGVQTSRDSDGQLVYAVKVLSNGRVRVYRYRQVE